MTVLDQILGDLTLYLRPDLVKKEYFGNIDVTGVDQGDLMRYYKALTGVRQAFAKVQRYDTYFAQFYPATDTVIPKHEALEHHVHAYLEDLDILKNKTRALTGMLKNDLKSIAANKDEIDKALSFLADQVVKVFEKVSAARNPHHHGGMKFFDKNILDAEVMHTMKKEDGPMRNMLTPEGIALIEKHETVSFTKAQENWIAIAKKNNEQLTGMMDEALGRIKGFIYTFLRVGEIKPPASPEPK
jgi:hypothetical protein